MKAITRKKTKRKTSRRKKRRTPAQIAATKKLVALNRKRRKKVNPKRSAKVMAKKRKRRVRKSYTPKKRYRRRRNPGGDKIIDIALKGAVGGVGTILNGYITQFVSRAIGGVGGGSPIVKNVVALATSILGAWGVKKFVKGAYGEALSIGMVAGSVVTISQNAFGIKPFGEELYLGDEVDALVESLDYSGVALEDNSDSYMGAVLDTEFDNDEDYSGDLYL